MIAFGLGLLFPDYGTRTNLTSDLLYQFLLVLAVTPIAIALTTVALKRAAGSPVSTKGVFALVRYYPQWIVIALVPFLAYLVLYSAPFLFQSLAIGITATAIGFSGYFLLDRDYSLFTALRSSLRLFLANIPQLFLFWLLSLVLSAAAALTLGIGFIWLMPFLYTAHALMYAQTAGLERFSTSEYQASPGG